MNLHDVLMTYASFLIIRLNVNIFEFKCFRVGTYILFNCMKPDRVIGGLNNKIGGIAIVLA